MSLSLLSIATAVPPRRIAQLAALDVARRTCQASPEELALVERFYRNSGVRSRHSVVLDARNGAHETEHDAPAAEFYPPASGPDDRGPTTSQRMRRFELEAPPLAIAAARTALERSQVAPADITHIVSLSCTGFHSPGFDVALVQSLGLRASVARTHVGFMGCHAALNGLRVARGYADARPDARVLMVAVELCSLHYQYGSQPERVIANALFADGAAALVGAPRAANLGVRPSAASAAAGDVAAGWSLLANGSTIVPDSHEAMRWLIRDHGFEMTLSPRVPDLILAHLRDWLDGWLGEHGLRTTDVRSWAIHPGGPRILAACGRACDLTEAQLLPSVEVLAEYGDMSSPTVLFILERLRIQRAAGPCVALAFGPGLTIEAALLDRGSP